MTDLQLDPTKTAVVLIEYQNEFTSEGGVLHEAVSPVMESTGMLANTVALVDAAHAAGVPVMHAPITFADGYNELSKHPYGILKGVVDGKAVPYPDAATNQPDVLDCGSKATCFSINQFQFAALIDAYGQLFVVVHPKVKDGS